MYMCVMVSGSMWCMYLFTASYVNVGAWCYLGWFSLGYGVTSREMSCL